MNKNRFISNFRHGLIVFPTILLSFLFTGCKQQTGTPLSSGLFVFDNNQETRWSTPENPNGEKGNGGRSNDGAKGHAFDSIGPGQSYILLDIQNPGIINRMWITINDQSPEMLRSLKIEMFWDNETKAAVSVPFGDFFGVGLGKQQFSRMLFLQMQKAGPSIALFPCLSEKLRK